MDAIGEGAVKYIPGAGGINGIAQRGRDDLQHTAFKKRSLFRQG